MTLFVSRQENPSLSCTHTLEDIFTQDVVVSINRIFKAEPEELEQKSINKDDLLKIVRAQEKLFTYLSLACFEVPQLRDIRHRLYNLSTDLEDTTITVSQ